MANQWFRFYSEFADDPKVQMMPENMQRRLVMLFCARCKFEKLRENEIPFLLRLSSQETAITKSLFLEKGFIDDGWNVLNWKKRQYISDSSTERVKRFRDSAKRFSNVSETFPKRSRSVSETLSISDISPFDQ
jgi:hypothetical protein